MWAYRTLNVLLTTAAWIVLPVEIVTTTVLGILVSATFGLLLFPMSLIWIVLFLGPLLGLSWVWEKAPLLRIPVAVLGIPLALVANTYAALMPCMGDFNSRVCKMFLSESWPYSLDFWRMVKKKSIPNSPGADVFSQILVESSRGDRLFVPYLQSLGVIQIEEQGLLIKVIRHRP